MADAHWLRKGVLRFLLKIMWSIGGHTDHVDGMPRVYGADFRPVLDGMRPGDVVLLGNNGVLTHIGMHVGEGSLVHSMATEKTMRGWLGSLWDALLRLIRHEGSRTGVVEEPLLGFLDRFERDTWVILRHPSVDDDAAQRGITHIRGLLGKSYDYDFSPDDDEYYCTEIVDEFLRAALGERAPRFATTHHKVPMLLDQHVLEPVAVLKHADMEVVAANSAATVSYAMWVPESRRIPLET